MTLTLAQLLSKQETIVAIVAAVVVLAVAGLGYQDVMRFSFRRVRAIAGVCFTEALRRRVLWVTPLAIIGVIAISQLTRPLDEQDAIRQTTRYCLFAAGLLVVVTAILLAATNLPKEIESRVIFTIVTKPTTRLEIVLGKVMGFAFVSGVILLIMGTFTFAYLELRAWSLVKNMKTELAAMEAEDAAHPVTPAPARPKAEPATSPSTNPSTQPSVARSDDQDSAEADAAAAQASSELNRRIRKQTLRRYAEGGLMGTKAIAPPADLQVYARDPGFEYGPNASHWIGGGQQLFMLVPMVLTEADKQKVLDLLKENRPAYLVIRLRAEQEKNPLPDELKELENGNYPLEGDAAKGSYKPQITVNAHAAATGQYLAKTLFQGQIGAGPGLPRTAEPIAGKAPTSEREWRILLGIKTADQRAIDLAPLNELLEAGRFNLEVSGVTPTYDFLASPRPISIVVPNGDDFDKPLLRIDSSATESVDPPNVSRGDSDVRSPPGVRFLSRYGRTGMQLSGRAPSAGDGPVAVYHFSGVGEVGGSDGQAILQAKIAVDRAGDLDAARGLTTSVAEIVVRNRTSKTDSKAIQIEPQTGRLMTVAVPIDSVAGGEFDVLIRGRTPGQQLALHGLTATMPSVTLVRAEHSFLLNLFKALLLLWLLSILVVTIAVFCSTFLSWPIAVVLTLLLLLGRWGIDALGDSLAPGSSRAVAQDLFRIRDPSKNSAVTNSLEALSSVLRNLGPILPDVSRFPVFEDIDRGVSIPVPKVGEAGLQLVLYGIPLLMLTYLILRNKEVAP